MTDDKKDTTDAERATEEIRKRIDTQDEAIRFLRTQADRVHVEAERAFLQSVLDLLAHRDARLAAIVQGLRELAQKYDGIISTITISKYADQLAALQPEDGTNTKL